MLQPAFGLAPHELLLLVNEDSQESLAVANHYIDARDIPARNVVYLSIPENPGWLSPEQFSEHIEEPVLKVLMQRRLIGQALVWVYSAGFPFKVTTKPHTSITGLPMVRGDIPPEASIKAGAWRSPFFGGPPSQGGPRGPSISLVRLSTLLTTNMVPVCMSLGYIGERGLDVEDITAMIDRSVAADCSKPKQAVLISTNANVRSTCRKWLMESEPDFARKAGRAVQIDSANPPGTYSGYMTGAASVPTDGLRFVGGSFAEHLTSFGGAFDIDAQMKCSSWIRAGATATSGAVTEPFALWTKFVSPRVFEHQAMGLANVEAMVLSSLMPLQSYFMGEPLCAPYMDRIAFEPTVVVDAALELVTITPNLPKEDSDLAWVILVDGFLASGRLDTPRISIPFKQLSHGWHELRVFAYRNKDFVRHYGQVVTGFMVPGEKEAFISIDVLDDGKLRCRVAANGKPATVRLSQGLRVLGEGPVIELDASRLGKGPVSLHAEADYAEDKMRVRSKPFRHVFK